MDIVGLIPAGGKASRLGKIPCSKEVFPVIGNNGTIKVTSSNLIEYFHKAGIKNIFYIIRKGKWDIPEYFGDGNDLDVHIGYLMVNLPYGTPFTVDQAFPFTGNSISALGFPDIIIYPDDAFIRLKSGILENTCDLMLGIVPSKEYLASDMIEFDDAGQIKDIAIKQNRPDLKYSWFAALWRPSFGLFMHNFLTSFMQENPDGLLKQDGQAPRELYMGDLFRLAIEKNLKVDCIIFENGGYTDLGTPGSIYRHMQ